MKRPLAFSLGVLLLTLLGSQSADAADPTAADRLSDQTIAYVRIRNTAELAERIQLTALGNAAGDPQVRPLIEHLWGSLVPTLEKFEEQAGMGLDDLAAAAPGQLVLALVNVPARPPAGVVMFLPAQPDELEKTLERGASRLADVGFATSSESFEGARARVLTRDEGPVQELIQLQLDEWRIISTDRQVAAELVASWRGDDVPSLTDHAPFRTIMSRCATEDSPSQIDWYVDPIATVRAMTRGNFGAAAAMALLPAIGADGLQAVGGRMILADDNYDLILRTHLLLEPPRDGVLDLLALKQGTSEPEIWVPADTANYVTWHWGFQQTFSSLQELVDSFRGEGALAALVKRRLSDPLGVDVQQDVLPLLSGRVSRIIRFEQPPSLTSQSTAVGIEVEDREKLQEQWSKVMEKFADSIEKTNFAGMEVYEWTRTAEGNEVRQEEPEAPSDDPGAQQREQRRRRRQEARQRWQQARPVAALVGDYLIIADRMSLLQHIIMTYDNAAPRLKDELDYKLVISKLRRHSTTPPGMFRFERPEEGLRLLYQLLQTDDMRRQVHEARERHPFFQALDELLSENRLPPFAVLAQYLAPGGSMLVNEESGFHHVSFGLRRQIEQPLGVRP